MIWAFQNEWSSRTQFTLNFYCHWATLVVRNMEYGSCHFLHRKEGLTQGHLLSMIAYGIGVLPLIRDLRDAHTSVIQPWYADEVGKGGDFGHSGTYRQGSHRRDTSWNQLIVSWLWPCGTWQGRMSSLAAWG